VEEKGSSAPGVVVEVAADTTATTVGNRAPSVSDHAPSICNRTPTMSDHASGKRTIVLPTLSPRGIAPENDHLTSPHATAPNNASPILSPHATARNQKAQQKSIRGHRSRCEEGTKGFPDLAEGGVGRAGGDGLVCINDLGVQGGKFL